MSPQSRDFFSRSWYHAGIAEFEATTDRTVLGHLAANSQFDVDASQRDAWLSQIAILKIALTGFRGTLFLEFSIPRMGKRVDAILVSGPIVVILEFKVGANSFDGSAIDQVWDYALDLKNFHSASHGLVIVPILVATDAPSFVVSMRRDADDIFHPLRTNSADLRKTLELSIAAGNGDEINSVNWAKASYKPTPTIVEAARALYANHSVEAIARFEAGGENLGITSKRIEELIDEAKAKSRKFICFVTGVPGAGKTLVGLNVATRRSDESSSTHAVFLSGNGPLVAVLREALIRDEVLRSKARGISQTKSKVGQSVRAFIQNVHHFRDEYLEDLSEPDDRVVIFDEAQRAWNLRKTANFMQRKKGKADFGQSEPEFLISCMNRHNDWAVIVCLVGGGQEINDGEAGIGAWLEAVNKSFPSWHVYISSKLTDSEYEAGDAVENLRQHDAVHFDDRLHLTVPMRSFRAEKVSAFVKALLDCELGIARDSLASIESRFPIVMTRDLNAARNWVRSKSRGTERFGILASSKAQRLKPHAIDIRVSVDPICWFLNGKEDTRSSYYLEDAATEFQVQGLELDWTCVTWDGDFRYVGDGWSFHDFRGSRWTNIAKRENQSYLRNAYRVLLTRARQGMVIFVPPGDDADPTRAPEYYDSTYRYLAEVGIPTIT